MKRIWFSAVVVIGILCVEPAHAQVSEQDLINKLSADLTIYTNQQGVLYSNLRAESERRAYLI